MTVPFTLFTSNFNPSQSELNAMINTLNALFANVTAAGDSAVAGNLSVTGTTALTGNVAVNTNKFTVTASNGNTLVAGTLAVTGVATLATDLTITSGNILNSSGNLTLTSGNLLLTLGNATLTAGNLVLTLGGFTVTNGAVLHTTGNHTMTNGHILHSTANALTAVGTTRADALALTKQTNNVTSAAAGTGVVLPAGVIGMEITLFNAGANAIQVYGNGSDTIDGVAAATGVPLTNAKRAKYFCVAAATYVSAQMGVVSA